MRIGDTVRMTEGPFVGMQGKIVSSIRRRVVIAVVLESREVQIEIERGWIGATSPPLRSTLRIEFSDLTQRAAG